jgi:hypothetical protein
VDAGSLYFGRRLLDLIREKQEALSKPLLMGQASDWGDYKHRAGYLKGLSDVIAWMEKISFEDEEQERRP